MRKEDGKIVSEGKLLEVIPIIEAGSGTPMMLPPAIWHVPNFVLGFEDWHILTTPMMFWQNQKTYIPGSNGANQHRMTFIARFMEDSAMPEPLPAGHIDAKAVKELLQAIRIAPDMYPGDS